MKHLRFFPALCMCGIMGIAFASTQSSPSPGAQESTVVLSYKEVVFTPLEIEFEISSESVQFTKMPEKSLLEPVTGLFPVGSDEEEYIPFAWFKLQQRLYFDLNRNYDLSDDPGGMFTGERDGFNQRFSNIKLEIARDESSLPYLIDLSMNDSSNIPTCTVSMHSLFHTQIPIAGKMWDFAVCDNLDGEINISLNTANSDCLVLRPVDPEGKPFGSCTTAHMDILNCPASLYLNNCAFALSYGFDTASDPVSLNIKVRPYLCETGTIQLSGDPVGFLILEGDHTIIIDRPAEEVRVPAGEYPAQRLAIQKDHEAKSSWCSASERLKVLKDNRELFKVDLKELSQRSPTYASKKYKVIVKSSGIVFGDGVKSSNSTVTKRRVRAARTSSG